MHRWKSGYPKVISLIKLWSQQNPILFLNIQALSKIVCFEIKSKSPNSETAPNLHVSLSRNRNRPIAFGSTILRFGMSRHKTVWYEAQYPLVSFLCWYWSPNNASGWHFCELFPQHFPQKQVTVRNIKSSCSWLYVTSGPRPKPCNPRSRTKMASFWRALTSHRVSRIWPNQKFFAANHSKK